MIEAVATQLENNKRQQEQYHKDFYRYSELAIFNLKMWGCRNAKLLEKNDAKQSIGRCQRTSKGDVKGVGAESKKGEKGS